ncbi:hypothetical protein C8Q75DRAFT_721498 [Abortiporus biennis]|nr:hypothetical protein C8Q75DRAFT_721498 [Abortiporus biennis]
MSVSSSQAVKSFCIPRSFGSIHVSNGCLVSDSLIKIIAATLFFSVISRKSRCALYPFYDTQFLIGTEVIQIGSQLRLLCLRTLGNQFTFELSVVRGHKLLTSGTYSIVSHMNIYHIVIWITSGHQIILPLTSIDPAYLGICMISAIWLFHVSIVSVMTIQMIPKKDLVVKMEFKEQWERWAKKTLYRFIPFVH